MPSDDIPLPTELSLTDLDHDPSIGPDVSEGVSTVEPPAEEQFEKPETLESDNTVGLDPEVTNDSPEKANLDSFALEFPDAAGADDTKLQELAEALSEPDTPSIDASGGDFPEGVDLSEVGDREGIGSDDESTLMDIENASFEDILSSIDDALVDGPRVDLSGDAPLTPQQDAQPDFPENPDLDLQALLSDEPDDFSVDVELSEEGDLSDAVASNEDKHEEGAEFLDVETLLEESLEEEREPMSEQDLDIDVNLEEFVGVAADGDVIDVDKGQGINAKLDLAHAYLEIDDPESAQTLLSEVLAQGSEEQQQEAKEILARLKGS